MTDSSRSAVVGAAGGIVAYLLGYVFTYALAASKLQNSGYWNVVESVGDGGQGWKVIGWAFYNAHFAETTIRLDVPIVGGTSVVNLIAELGLSNLLYVLPPALLVGAGVLAATTAGASSTAEALRVGPTVALGYLPATIAGVFLFRVTVEGSFGGPTVVTGIGLAGFAYPLAFGTVGAVLAAALASDAARRGSPA